MSWTVHLLKTLMLWPEYHGAKYIWVNIAVADALTTQGLQDIYSHVINSAE